jgi:signal transduction histidine kinase
LRDEFRVRCSWPRWAELEVFHPEWTIRRETLGDSRGNWDSDRLVQVISNLVSNAGEHGQRGGTIVVKIDGLDSGSVIAQIHNEGVVPPDLLPSLFDPFCGRQARSVASRGLGLGLFIVREIVRSHGGTVDVASSERSGTTFTMRLPRCSSSGSAGSAVPMK